MLRATGGSSLWHGTFLMGLSKCPKWFFVLPLPLCLAKVTLFLEGLYYVDANPLDKQVLGELMNQDNLRFQYQYKMLRIRSLTDFHMLVKCRIHLRALLLQTLHAPSSTVVTVSQKVEQMLYGNSGLPLGLLGKEPATAVEYISTRGLCPPRLRMDWVMMDHMYESWNMKIF